MRDGYRDETVLWTELGGYHVDRCYFGEIPRPSQDIISLLDLEKPFINNIAKDKFEQFKAFLDNLGTSGILWITRSIQMRPEDPDHSLFLGLARTIRCELSIPLTTLELDTIDTYAFDAIVNVFHKFQGRDITAQVDPDWEFALHSRQIYIGRYHWISVNEELASMTDSHRQPIKLEIARPGLLHSLNWVRYPLRALGADEVVVEPKFFVGMNFKDILVTMSIVDDEGAGLGLEGAGQVQAVGSNVKHLKVGDRVMTMDDNCFSTRKVSLAQRCVKIPDSLSFQDAATMPCVYSTVIYSLIKMAHLRRGQTILIHSACGGVGIAAIQLCQMIGAKIFATVGSDEKSQYLVDTFSIPKANIFYSRDESSFQILCAITPCVLEMCRIPGKASAPRLTCPSKMIEIGRRDFIGRAQLSMDLFEGNRSFIGVNLALLADQYHELLSETIALYSQGHIKPISPIQAFTASDIENAFRYMQKGQHIGKLVVSLPDPGLGQISSPTSLSIAPRKQPFHLRPDSAYLLAGGLGGLGRAIANYLIECGARHLIFISRSAGTSSADKAFFTELECQGCSVDAVSGSVANIADCRRAIACATRVGKHIGGVMQLSMVLRDLPIMKMSHEDWMTAIEPKVDGTWNLHNALMESKHEVNGLGREGGLEFFVMFSSALGCFGAAHHSNYAAGNTFQDAFVQYRHSLGLPASVLDVGVMADRIQNNMRTTGMWFLSEQDLLDALHLSIANGTPPYTSTTPNGNETVGDKYISKAQLGIGFRSTKPLTDPSNRVLWRRDKRMSIYQNLEGVSAVLTPSSSGEHDALGALMSKIEGEPMLLFVKETTEFLTREIGCTI
ncbi:KR domain-containing protein [Lipomyces mesembrius]